MIELLRQNAQWITLLFLIVGSIVGWLLFDKDDWGK